MQVGIDIGNQSDGYRLTVGEYAGMQVDIDISNESDGYRLTREVSSGVQLCIEIGNESDGYHLPVGGYSRDAGRFCIGIESGGIILQGGYSMMQVGIDV